jgi:hypothetical protein
MLRQIAVAVIVIAATASVAQAEAAIAEAGQDRPHFAVPGQQAKTPAPAEAALPNVNDDDTEIAEAPPEAAPPTAPAKAPPPAVAPPAPRKIAPPVKAHCKPAIAIVRGKRIAYCVPVRR